MVTSNMLYFEGILLPSGELIQKIKKKEYLHREFRNFRSIK